MMPQPLPPRNSLWRYIGPGFAHGAIQRVVISNALEIVSVHEFAGFALLRGGPQWSYLGTVEEFLRDFKFVGSMPTPNSGDRYRHY